MSSTKQDEEDEFFGNDDSDNEVDFMALQEGKAAERNLQTTAYLDAFDEHKEARLQQGFEAGYREVHALAHQLGERLGKLVARAKIQGTTEAQIAAGRYREVLSDINKGSVSNEDVKRRLLELEDEMSQI